MWWQLSVDKREGRQTREGRLHNKKKRNKKKTTVVWLDSFTVRLLV